MTYFVMASYKKSKGRVYPVAMFANKRQATSYAKERTQAYRGVKCAIETYEKC